MSVRFMLNETSYFGKGAREELAPEIKNRGFKKAFVVTDKSLAECGVINKVTDVLEKAGIPFEVYSEVKPNPTIKNVTDGIEACKKIRCRCNCCSWWRIKHRYSKRNIYSYDKPR